MVENQPQNPTDDLPDGSQIADDWDLFFRGKLVEGAEVISAPVEVKTRLQEVEEGGIDYFLTHQIPHIPTRSAREEVEGLRKAFPFWRENNVKNLRAKGDPINLEAADALEGLTLRKLAEYSKNQLECFIKEKVNTNPNDKNYSDVSFMADYWSRIEEITKYAADEER